MYVHLLVNSHSEIKGVSTLFVADEADFHAWCKKKGTDPF
jgi:hypothetical protein